MAIAAKIILSDRNDRWRSPRRPLSLDATLRAGSGTPLDVRIYDLSVSGFLMEAEAELEIGNEIHIGIGGIGVSSARVIRTAGNLFGCEFRRAIASQDLVAAKAAEVLPLHLPDGGEDGAYPEPVVALWTPQARLAVTIVPAALCWVALLFGAKALLA